MDKNKIKNDVLEELIALMESKEVEGLKSKSPKFMKLEVEAMKLPDKSDELNKPEKQDESEMSSEPEMFDKPDELETPDKQEDGENMPDKQEDNDDLKRLLEMYNKLK